MKSATAQHPAPSQQTAGQAEPDCALPDFASMGQDWITLWQSELAALATDREVQETRHLMLSIWAGGAGVIWQAATQRPKSDGASRPATPGVDGHSAQAGSARPAGAPRSTATAAASDAGLDEIDQLRGRVAQLEQRLAALESHPGPLVRRPRGRAKPPRA